MGTAFYVRGDKRTVIDPSLPLRMTPAVRCHSERNQESLEGKMGNGIVAQSEESIALMTPYRLPHHRHRFFAGALNDA